MGQERQEETRCEGRQGVKHQECDKDGEAATVSLEDLHHMFQEYAWEVAAVRRGFDNLVDEGNPLVAALAQEADRLEGWVRQASRGVVPTRHPCAEPEALRALVRNAWDYAHRNCDFESFTLKVRAHLIAHYTREKGPRYGLGSMQMLAQRFPAAAGAVARGGLGVRQGYSGAAV